MRYEVRGPAGNLIGLYNGPLSVPMQVRLLSQSPLKMRVAGDLALIPAEETITARDILLDRRDVQWEPGTVVPTLVLRSGRRSWLNDVKGFRRI